ncbi:MFS transporter [Pelagicoccus albus]
MPRPVFVLIVGMFVNRLGSFVYPFLSLYLKDRSFEFSEISLVIGSLAVGNFFGPMAGGYMADAFGRRNALVISLLSTAFLLLALYWADDYVTLLVVGFCYGFSVSTFFPPANALLSDLVEEDKRATAFALFRLAINLGFALGPTLAGILYAISPMWIFVGDAATTAAFGLLAWVSLPHGLRTISGKVGSASVVWKSWREAIVDAWGNVSFRRFIFASFLMGAAFTQVFSLLSITSTDRGLSTFSYGLVMGLNGLLIAMVELPLTHRIKRFAPRKVLSLGYTLMALGSAGFAFSESITGFLLAMSLFTMGEIVALPVGMSYSAALSPEALRGRYFGIRGMTWAASTLFSSLGVSFYGAIGFDWWLIIACLPLAGAVYILRNEPLKKPLN